MDLSRNIGFIVKGLSHQIMNGMDRLLLVGDLNGVTGVHGMVIAFLANHGEKPALQRDLEKHLKLSRSTVTELLQLMEKNGLIVRESVDFDARQKQIRLTPAAVEMQEKLEGQIEAFEEMLKAGISQTELDSFYSTIEKMRQNISKAVSGIK